MTFFKQLAFLLLFMSAVCFLTAGQVFTVVDQTSSALYMHFTLPDFQMVKTDGGQLPNLEYESGFYKEGLPNLPIYPVTFGLPSTGNPQMTVEVTQIDTLSNIDIAPWHEPTLATPASRDTGTYSHNAFFPSEQAMLGVPAIMRDIRIDGLNFFPLRYNAVTRQLVVVKEAEIRVDFGRGHVGANELERDEGSSSQAFNDMARGMLINYSHMPQRSTFTAPRLLIIYYDNSDLLNYLNTLVTWKHQMGYIVDLASTATTGTTTTAIKSYLQTRYDNASTRPDFVMMVGDAGSSDTWKIPCYTSTWDGNTGCSDHQYSTLSGNDEVEDVFLGRLSCNDVTTLRVMIAKIMQYEKTPNTTSTSWYNRAVLVGDDTYSGLSTEGTNKIIKSDMSLYNSNYTFSELYDGVGSTAINNLLNTGCSIWNYRGWIGMSGWDSSGPDGMTNQNMLPVCVIITCSTGNFDSTDMTETVTRLGTLSNLKGGVCAIGSSTSHTQTSINNTLDTGIFQGLFGYPNLRTIGQALQFGKSRLVYNYGITDPTIAAHFSCINNLIGDPSLQVFKGLPVSMTVTAPSNIATGTDQMEVVVRDASNNPVPNAWVTALLGSDAIFSTGMTDANGRIFLSVNTTSTGTANLTVTKTGYWPYVGTFTVSTATASLRVNATTIDDDNSGESSGNGNATINPGETIELKVQLTNNGSTSLSSVTGILTTSSTGVSITDNSETWSTIASGASAYCTDDFNLVISSSLDDGVELVFNLALTSGSNTFNRQIVLTVRGSKLVYTGSNVSGTGLLTPNGSSTMTVSLTNSGTVATGSLTGTLSCNNSAVTINNPTVSWGVISAGNTVANTTAFNIVVGTIGPGTQVTMTLVLNATGYSRTLVWNQTVGVAAATDPLGPDAYGYYILDSNDNYSQAPAYNWVDISSSGTNLSLNDTGDNYDRVNNTSLSLPFAFKFYGTTFAAGTRISVCSNGWFCFGSTEIFEHRNHHLPGNSNPPYMVAPFWDDLYESNGACYYYNDTANHRLIIMWKNYLNFYSHANETFEAILLDPAYYPTTTGDGQILFQYNAVANNDAGAPSGSSVEPANFATVGIANGNATVGLEYTYGNMYPSTCPTLTAGTALLITTNPGNVLGLPEAFISTGTMDISSPLAGTGTGNFTIYNNGEGNLSYSIEKAYVQTSTRETRNSGGPDTFGYRWADSNSADGPTYNWYDISSIGTTVTFSSSDDAVTSVSLPFSFPFYGVNKTTAKIGTNGFVSFASTVATMSTNEAFSSTCSLSDGIALFWEDLHQRSGSCKTYYDQANSRFIIQYTNWGFFYNTTGFTGLCTMQMQLYQSGQIMLVYNTVGDNMTSGTVGIINTDGSTYLQVNYNSAYLTNNMAIRFYTYPDWLSLSSGSGRLSPNTSLTINCTAAAGSFAAGNYVCNLHITTNDSNLPQTTIPVTMHIGTFNPAAPINVAVAKVATGIQLTWAPVTTDINGSNTTVTGYRVYRGSLGSANFTLLGQTSSTQYIDTSANSATGYQYRVTAYRN